MRVGILGAGQLCKMLIQAGLPLGFELSVFAPKGDHCIPYHKDVTFSTWDDNQALKDFAKACDVVTIESENIPKEVASIVQEVCTFAPNVQALIKAQDRLLEKQLFDKLQIPNVPYAQVDSKQQLHAFVQEQDYPVILKRRRLGYDGKGQWRIKSKACVDALDPQILTDCIVEKAIQFDREASILGVRTHQDLKFYDLCQNTHHQGVLHHTQNMPGDPLFPQACELLSRLMIELDYVGCCALELFEVDGQFYANEMAPRVHNSGHWTIEGAQTSQFENHVRAIAGLPIGDTSSRCKTHMVNILGSFPDASSLLKQNLHLHDYGKTYKPGRKRGHVTSTQPLQAERLNTLIKSCAFEQHDSLSMSA